MQWGGVRRDAELQCYRQTKVESFRITELQCRVTELKGIHTGFREMRGYKTEESRSISFIPPWSHGCGGVERQGCRDAEGTEVQSWAWGSALSETQRAKPSHSCQQNRRGQNSAGGCYRVIR